MSATFSFVFNAVFSSPSLSVTLLCVAAHLTQVPRHPSLTWDGSVLHYVKDSFRIAVIGRAEAAQVPMNHSLRTCYPLARVFNFNFFKFCLMVSIYVSSYTFFNFCQY